MENKAFVEKGTSVMKNKVIAAAALTTGVIVAQMTGYVAEVSKALTNVGDIKDSDSDAEGISVAEGKRPIGHKCETVDVHAGVSLGDEFEYSTNTRLIYEDDNKTISFCVSDVTVEPTEQWLNDPKRTDEERRLVPIIYVNFNSDSDEILCSVGEKQPDGVCNYGLGAASESPYADDIKPVIDAHMEEWRKSIQEQHGPLDEVFDDIDDPTDPRQRERIRYIAFCELRKALISEGEELPEYLKDLSEENEPAVVAVIN